MNSKSCGCNKCMQKTPKCTVMKSVCDKCKDNVWSDSNDDFDYSKFNNMMKKNKEVCGCREEYKKASPCRKNSCDCKKSNACDCQPVYKKSDSCGCQPMSKKGAYKKSYSCDCPLRGSYRKENNECAPTFACEVDSLPLAMAYVPYQEWNCNVSNACQGLCDGTIFPELVKPFICTPCDQERRNW